MRATLYEALGIPQSASTEEVRHALRGHIRKYYAKTRDGQGNVEEALRFINHASRILSDPVRRAEYDRQLALAQGAEAHIASVAASALDDAGDEHTDLGPATPRLDLEAALDSGFEDEVAEEPSRIPHHPGLTERFASFGRSPVLTVVVCAAFAAVIGAAIVFVTPEDAVLVGKQVLVWLTLVLLGLTVVYGVVHGLAWMHRRRGFAEPAYVPHTDFAILNWRREKSVFLGTNQPQEDASWIFQLRMAELERAKSGRTSEPRPWHRLAARLFDYAIWGLVLAMLMSEVRALDAVPDDVAYWLAHPLLAPVLITLSWVPAEALLLAALQTTPGKWLFGCFVQFSISDAYAPRDPATQLKRALRRGLCVWWEGVGAGFPLFAPIAAAVAFERLNLRQETDWDAQEDCLVTHGPPGWLNMATGVCGLTAMLWLYGVAWHQPLADSAGWLEQTIAARLPSPPALIDQGIAGGDRLLAELRSGMAGGAIGGTTARDAEPAREGGSSRDGSRRSEARGTTSSAPIRSARTPTEASAVDPVDPSMDNRLEQRRARIAFLKGEGPRMLRAGQWRRAGELCGAWTDLEVGNARAWQCYGEALQAQGRHREAVEALRKAKQLEPGNRSIEAALERSQKGIVADFLERYGR